MTDNQAYTAVVSVPEHLRKDPETCARAINLTLTSLQAQTEPPTEVLIGCHRPDHPAAPPVGEQVIYVAYQHQTYFDALLTAEAGCLAHRAQVPLLLVEAGNSYPPHLVTQYRTAGRELGPRLIDQINQIPEDRRPKCQGQVYGIGGVNFVTDRQRSLAEEYQYLTDYSLDGTIRPKTQRNGLGYFRDNATVEILEFAYSLWLPLSTQLIGLTNFLECNRTLRSVLPDLLFSVFLAQKNLVRVQLCTLVLNRYMMECLGCTPTINQETKNKLYLKHAELLASRNLSFGLTTASS